MAGQSPEQESKTFVRGAIGLIVVMIGCGVFAFLAGKEVGNKDVDFAIAFALLGVLVIGIFGLAWLDTTTKTGNHDFMRGQGHGPRA
jgi:hypothetical protein